MRQPGKMPITRTQMLILGYGYFRSYAEEPEFTLRQVAEASEQAGHHTDVSNLYVPAGRLAVAGYLRRRKVVMNDNPIYSGGAPPIGYVFEETGLKPLMDGVMYGVRRLGNTLPEMLRLSVSVDALVNQGNFFEHLADDLLKQSPAIPAKIRSDAHQLA